jgi:glycine/D-amino acid oxidase-like deaminating enzyme
MKTTSFWTDGLRRPPELKNSPLPRQVDVAIVGGGYTGLNAARVLVKSGASVAVLERKTIGWGASSRNGGMLTTGIKAPTHVMIDRYGKKLGHAFWQASLDAIDLVEEIVTEEDIDCDFRRSGHVGLAYKASHFEEMKKKAAYYRDELGHELRVVGPSELGEEIGSQSYYGGLVDEYSAGVHPAKYVLGLGAAIARQGACLCERTDVGQIRRTSKGFELETSQGSLSAGEVLIATNGYTDMLVSELKPRTFPVGSYIIVTEPLSNGLLEKLSPKGRMYYDSKNFLNYFRVTPDGRMLFGGRNNLSTDLDLEKSAGLLRRRMVEVFPELGEAPVTHSWTGKLGLTFDLMPHIGRIDGLHYALGYCGHGVSIASYVGTEAGMLLAGHKTSSPFAEISHPTHFFYRRSTWFLPLAAWYYRFLDWVS